jgi:hypothetical protein
VLFWSKTEKRNYSLAIMQSGLLFRTISAHFS